jgi:dihydropteroate synthase
MTNTIFQSLMLRGKVIDLSVPKVMAIINVTPDSFFSGSRAQTDIEIIQAASKAINDGASILDIGAYSTRPGADFVSAEDEEKRMQYALELIRSHFPDVLLSVDTFRANVARMAVEKFQVDIINDVSGGELDQELLSTVAQLNVPYILMHMKGTPQTMQSMTQYTDFLSDILKYFAEKIEQLRKLGHTKEIIIDPGLGFAKTVEQNYELLNHSELLHTFDMPVLIGLSRKSMIWKALNISASDALNGTTALHMTALMKGAHLLRVHDVKEAVEVVKLYQLLTSDKTE